MNDFNYAEIIYMDSVEKQLEYQKNKHHRSNYYKKHKEELKEKRNNTKEGRAKMLATTYKRFDRLFGRVSTLTSDQIMKLWDDGCYWCGETDWHKLGADRIDNSKPHTIDNVICSCHKCNVERQKKDFESFKKIKNKV